VLALGGGAARAAAHIGVLRALRERKMEVTGVAGTSGGALVGAMFLLGMSEDEILERFTTFPRTKTYVAMRRRYARYRRRTENVRRSNPYFQQSGLAFLSNAELAAIDDEIFSAFISHFVGADRDISTLQRPFTVAATDLVEGRLVVLGSGPLYSALRATCAVPGLFAPQAVEGRLLVEGSIIGEVPVKAALSLRPENPGGRLLAVHLDRPGQRVVHFTSSAEVLTRSNALVHAELVREQLRHAPEILQVALTGVGWLDFGRSAEAAESGYRAMLAYLDRLEAAR